MTTCDASITEVGGAFRCEVHNGLGGPATGLMFAMVAAIESNTAEGRFDEASVDAICSGELLLSVLPGLIPKHPWESWTLAGEPVQVDAILAMVTPDAKYRVSALEV